MLYLDMRTIHERVSGINKPQKMSGEVEKDQDKDTPQKEEKTGRPSSVDPTKIHSANSWESVDLGDDERKKKFLKLMGASKKEHHGRFVIGDQQPVYTHSREKTETEKVNQQLENQYKHSLDHKITRWHHKGLGFSNEEKKAEDGSKSTSAETEAKTEGADEKANQSGDSENNKGRNSDTVKDSESEKVDRKRESTDSNKDDSCASKKPKMMMSFVKASDS